MWLVLYAHAINHTDPYDLFIISKSIHIPKNVQYHFYLIIWFLYFIILYLALSVTFIGVMTHQLRSTDLLHVPSYVSHSLLTIS